MLITINTEIDIPILKKEGLVLFLDMDGVIANFSYAATRLHYNLGNAPSPNVIPTHWYWYTDWGISDKEFWAPINADPDFWFHVPEFSFAQWFYYRLCDLGKVFIITSPSSCPNCNYQKLRWLQRFAEIRIEDVVFTKRKELLSHYPNSLLIDDYINNCLSFGKAGHAFLFPRPYNNDKSYTFAEVFAKINTLIGD